MKKLICLLFVTLLVLSLTGCKKQEESIETAETVETEETVEAVEERFAIRKINKHGTLVLEIPASEFALKYEAGDIVNVTVGDVTVVMPVGTSYSDVDTGAMLVRLDGEDDETGIAVNNGSFVEETGMDESLNEVIISMNVKGGYLDEYKIRNLERTYAREDYPELSDEEYANFRMVTTTGIKEGILYRSSSPVDPDISRNTYADAAMKNAGIKTVVNVDDTEEEMLGYEGYTDTYYSTCTILNIPMGYDFSKEEVKEEFAETVRFMIQNEGPYLLHCKEGKDRTGISIALLEMLMGGNLEEIEEDYIKTYINFYKIEKGGDTYNTILESAFLKTFHSLFETEDLSNLDLTKEAHDYMIDCGLSEDEIETLKTKLS